MVRGKYGEVKGIELAPRESFSVFTTNGTPDLVAISIVPVEGQSFTQALRAETKRLPKNPWDAQVQARVGHAIDAGDVLLASFYARAISSRAESGEAQTEFVLELARDPWSKSVSYPLRVGHEWQKFFVRFEASQSYAPGEAQMLFRLGYEPQTIEIGGLSVENFAQQVTLTDLPSTKLSYAGREGDAPWRSAADERIDKLRKAELALRVLDRTGKPVAGAEVNVEQQRQAFGFGSAVVAQTLIQPGNERYKTLVGELFNFAVLENNLKWPPLEGEWGPGWTLDVAKQGLDWLNQRNIQARGHVLVWPSWRNLPKSLRALEKDPARLRQAVRRHVQELAGATRGKLAHWDVINEPFDNHDLMDLFGEDVMVEWFKAARAADPSAKLFINDYAILSGGGGNTAHRDHYQKTIAFLLERRAPLDGIGMQGHFGTALTSPEQLLEILDRFAKFGKTIWVTEYDVDVDDETLAADFTRDFYTALFSHPSVGGILMWGFWDGAHWHKNAPLYRQDFSLKPAGEVYRELVLERWRTRERGRTDGDGSYELRAFFGRYAIKVSAGGKTKTIELEHRERGAPVAIQLD
jgi:GH35 family endo-1,4-beta-xylanase